MPTSLRSLLLPCCLVPWALTGCVYPEIFSDSQPDASVSAAGDASTTAVDASGGATTGADVDSSSSGGVTTGDDAALFAALFFPGASDDLVVRTVDIESGACISVEFERLGGQGYFGDTVELPVNWRIAAISLYPDATDCLAPKGPPNPPVPVHPITAVGTGAWTTGFCPGPVAIDMTIGFAQDEPWVPAEVVVTAAHIPVWGC